jgi:hypothetical protein
MSFLITMLNNLLFIFFINFILCLPITNNPITLNVNETEILPNYNTYKLLLVQQNNYSTPLPFTSNQDEVYDLKDLVQANNGVLCTFSEETLKKHPSLTLYTVYCGILAFAWCFLVVTVCFSYIKQSIEKIHLIINGFRRNQQNLNVDEGRSEVLQRVLPIRQITTTV